MKTSIRFLSSAVMLLSMAALAQEPAGNAAAGRAVFAQNCAVCHGAGGKGDGPAAAGFNPRPANFLDAARAATPEDRQLRIVTNGGASEKLSPLMPAFSDTLSPQQVRDAVAFIRDVVQAQARTVANK